MSNVKTWRDENVFCAAAVCYDVTINIWRNAAQLGYTVPFTLDVPEKYKTKLYRII